MAQALCVPVTEHTYGDLMLSVNAQRLCLVRGPILFFSEHIQEVRRFVLPRLQYLRQAL